MLQQVEANPLFAKMLPLLPMTIEWANLRVARFIFRATSWTANRLIGSAFIYCLDRDNIHAVTPLASQAAYLSTSIRTLRPRRMIAPVLANPLPTI